MRRANLPYFIGAIVILAAIGPALLHLGGRFIGLEYVDHYGTQWFYWFVERQLRAGQGLGHTDLFFFPWGKDIFKHTGANVLDGLLAIPFRMLFGQVAGYNLFVLTGMGLSAWAFHGLARDYVDDRLAVWVATMAFTFSPFMLHDLREGRPTQSILLFLVLFLRYLLRAGRETGWRAPLLAGLMLALTGYQYWYYAFFGGMAALGHGVWLFLRPLPGSGGRWRTLARHTLIAALAFALVAPVAVPLVVQSSQPETVPGLIDVSRWSLGASPPITREAQTVGMYLWQPLRRYAGFHVVDADYIELFLDQGLLLPWFWAPLLLAFVLWPGPRLRRGVLLSMALVSMVLAMGSILIIGHYALPNPIYIALVKHLGFLQRLWWPARALVIVAILLPLVMAELIRHAGELGARWRIAAAVGLSALWLGEMFNAGALPLPTWDATVPAGYRCLKDGPEGALIELPHNWSQNHLYYQTTHHRPILGGMLENNPVFTPPEVTALWQDNSFLRELHAVSKLDHKAGPWSTEDRDALRDLGYRYLVLQKDAFVIRDTSIKMGDNVTRTRLRQMSKQLRGMMGRPVYEDSRIAIFAPWGDPSPCAGGAVVPDTKAVGPTEIQADERIVHQREVQVIRRVWETDWTEGLDDTGEADDTGATE